MENKMFAKTLVLIFLSLLIFQRNKQKIVILRKIRSQITFPCKETHAFMAEFKGKNNLFFTFWDSEIFFRKRKIRRK